MIHILKINDRHVIAAQVMFHELQLTGSFPAWWIKLAKYDFTDREDYFHKCLDNTDNYYLTLHTAKIIAYMYKRKDIRAYIDDYITSLLPVRIEKTPS